MKKITEKYSPTDLRAEVLAAELVEEGVDPDTVVFCPVSLFKRGYSPDVERWETSLSSEFPRTLILFYIHREGLYDALPEGLFHQHHFPIDPNDPDQLKKILEHINKNQKEEKEARSFFLAFEREFYLQRLILELEERECIKGFSQKTIKNQLVEFWDLVSTDDDGQTLSMLLYLLPLAYKAAGNPEVLVDCFQTVLGVQVQVQGHPAKDQNVPQDMMPSLGETTIGVDFTIGSTFNDGAPGTTIVVGPLSERAFVEYLPQGKKQKLVQLLVDLLLPVGSDVDLKMLVERTMISFKLSEKIHEGRLGYTTFL